MNRTLRRFLMTALAVTSLGAMSAMQASPASAHLGDWYTQYNVTAKRAVTHGKTHYYTSGAYGEHSRHFIYGSKTLWGWTYRTFYIGHSYDIWQVSAPWQPDNGMRLNCDGCAVVVVRG